MKCACKIYDLGWTPWVAFSAIVHTEEKCGQFRQLRADGCTRVDLPPTLAVWWQGEECPRDWNAK